MCERCGVRCFYCGHAPGERLEAPPPPQEPDPIGDGPGRWVCRYCSQEFDTAAEVRDHQARRHVGCGERMVMDVVELHPVK